MIFVQPAGQTNVCSSLLCDTSWNKLQYIDVQYEKCFPDVTLCRRAARNFAKVDGGWCQVICELQAELHTSLYFLQWICIVCCINNTSVGNHMVHHSPKDPLPLLYWYTSKVTTPQDAHRRLVLQVYLGSNTSEFIGEIVIRRFRKQSSLLLSYMYKTWSRRLKRSGICATNLAEVGRLTV